jgi:hypothetical protein
MTYTALDVTADYIKKCLSENGMLDEISASEIEHTCEHCKWWNNSSLFVNNTATCSNKEVEILVDGGMEDNVYYDKTFGCIFWEGKE